MHDLTLTPLLLDYQRQYENSFLIYFCSWVEGLLVLGCCLMSAANRVSHSKTSVTSPVYLSLTVPWKVAESENCDGWL
jgi:hypothetical protein